MIVTLTPNPAWTAHCFSTRRHCRLAVSHGGDHWHNPYSANALLPADRLSWEQRVRCDSRPTSRHASLPSVVDDRIPVRVTAADPRRLPSRPYLESEPGVRSAAASWAPMASSTAESADSVGSPTAPVIPSAPSLE
jgi:hypothetical protein